MHNFSRPFDAKFEVHQTFTFVSYPAGKKEGSQTKLGASQKCAQLA